MDRWTEMDGPSHFAAGDTYCIVSHGQIMPRHGVVWAELLSAAHWGSQSKKGAEAWFAHKSLGEHMANSGGANANS